MHLLKKFVPVEECTQVTYVESFEMIQKYPSLLMDTLNGLEITIKNYDISWSESLETSCITLLLMTLLSIADLSVQVNLFILFNL